MASNGFPFRWVVLRSDDPVPNRILYYPERRALVFTARALECRMDSVRIRDLVKCSLPRTLDIGGGHYCLNVKRAPDRMPFRFALSIDYPVITFSFG